MVTPISRRVKCSRFLHAMEDKRHRYDGNKNERMLKYLGVKHD